MGAASASAVPWHAVPAFVTRVGPKQGKRASWIGASGDQTFIKLDESLINEKQFQHSKLIASNNYFGEKQEKEKKMKKKNCLIKIFEFNLAILPTHSNSSFHNLVISRNDGQCRSFSGSEQVEFTNSLVTWDAVYGVTWRYTVLSFSIHIY